MKAVLSILAVMCLVSRLVHAAPPPADEVLAQAKAKASAERKTVFVHFGASWCIWCKRLDAFLDRPEIKPIFDQHFVSVKLVVMEDEKHKDLESPGADALLRRLSGPSGLPYFAFLDADGEMIGNSKLDRQNIGYPAEPKEIDWFLRIVKRAAPLISDANLKTIETALKDFKRP